MGKSQQVAQAAYDERGQMMPLLHTYKPEVQQGTAGVSGLAMGHTSRLGEDAMGSTGQFDVREWRDLLSAHTENSNAMMYCRVIRVGDGI